MNWVRQENINEVETKAMKPSDDAAAAATATEPVNSEISKSAYNTFYIYPRAKGNVSNSPNLHWHQTNAENRGRSLSPKSSTSIKVEAKSSSLTREASMPTSSILVKKSMEKPIANVPADDPKQQRNFSSVTVSVFIVIVKATKCEQKKIDLGL